MLASVTGQMPKYLIFEFAMLWAYYDYIIFLCVCELYLAVIIIAIEYFVSPFNERLYSYFSAFISFMMPAFRTTLLEFIVPVRCLPKFPMFRTYDTDFF